MHRVFSSNQSAEPESNKRLMKLRNPVFALILVCLFCTVSYGQKQPVDLEDRIALLKAQDELRFDETIKNALKSPNAELRKTAALAAGRIGDEEALQFLEPLLSDNDPEVAQMAMFGIGELETINSAEVISKWLRSPFSPMSVRMRTIEAAGKTIGAHRDKEEAKKLSVELLKATKVVVKADEEPTSTLAITALLRSRPEGAGLVLSEFLNSKHARVRSDAANVIARLRFKDALEKLRLLHKNDKNGLVRANAARALGALKDKDSLDSILNSALIDKDSRVRTNSISAVAAFEDKASGAKLITRAEQLYVQNKGSGVFQNELLALSSAIGRIFRASENPKAIAFLTKYSESLDRTASEVEVAFVRVSPGKFMNRKRLDSKDWRAHAALAAALGETAEKSKNKSQQNIRKLARITFAGYLKSVWDGRQKADMAFPAVLSNYAKFKTNDLGMHLRRALIQDDVVVRGTAARLLGELEIPKTNKLENYFALRDAFENAEKDRLNDAELAALEALGKQIPELQKDKRIIIDLLEPIKSAQFSPDYLVRRKAKEIGESLKLSMVGKSEQVSYKTKGNHRLLMPNYRRALTRMSAKAVIETKKGKFEIEFYPQEAPLTVENFVSLAKKGYFNGLTIHRVIPNFVMQDGDPRGDGSGGPGWHIRCEINQLRYERGTVGMALSGKDTGGSQWFVGHSPQPHLDGGYTVFGKVNENGMKVVDKLSRGDKIVKVTIEERIFDIKAQ